MPRRIVRIRFDWRPIARGIRPPLRPGVDDILAVMRSNVARDVSRRREERHAALTPAERVALAMRLGEAGLASFMATLGVDRDTARARIAATRRAGRRHSSTSNTSNK